MKIQSATMIVARIHLLALAIMLMLTNRLIAGEVQRPFILWTAAEVAATKTRLASDPIAKQQLQRMEQFESGKRAKGSNNSTMYNLFKYAFLDDQKAGDAELAELRKFIGQVPEPLTEEFKKKMADMIKEAGDPDKIWQRGMASFGDRHMRDDQSMQALRYDVLYDRLTAEERSGVETAMRSYLKFHLDGHKPWHPDFHYKKMSWLPNMSWPRTIGTHLFAVALRDDRLIAEMFNSVGGFKWFFDGYVSDGRFYNEEFGKYYSNIGAMLLWCESLERLGHGAYGWGYTGTGGATMRRFLNMYADTAYPRTTIPGGMANYRRISMGDAKGPLLGLLGVTEHSMVNGYLPDGKGGNDWYNSGRMNGPYQKMSVPLWYEIGFKRWPQDGYGYFLAQLRQTGDPAYLPSLYFGLGAIDPEKVSPPAATSYLAKERGFAFLRSEESPAYWEGPAPALSQQFGLYYAHYAHDCFSILGMQAFNRPIYINTWGGNANHFVNEQIKNGPNTGYIARHPWLDTVRGYCGVVVDNLQARPVESGEEGLKNHVMRSNFAGPAKFVAGRTTGIYPEVETERAHLLCRDYDLDVYRLTSPTPRRYEWQVHGPGRPELDASWKETSELNGSMLYRPLTGPDAAQPAGYESKLDGNDLANVFRRDAANADWSLAIVQTCAVEIEKSVVGKAWYDRGIGVRVRMLGSTTDDGKSGTTIFTGKPPGSYPVVLAPNEKAPRPASLEFGGTTVIVRRTAPSTVFTALHEPFAGGSAGAKVATFTRLAESAQGVAVAITGVAGSAINDRAVVRYGAQTNEPVSFAFNSAESITVADHAWIRIGSDVVDAWGDIKSLKLVVSGNPKLRLNGADVKSVVQNGALVFPAQ